MKYYIPESVLNEIHDFTQNNDVYGAWITICDKVLGEELIEEEQPFLKANFELLEKKHSLAGYLTPGIQCARQCQIDHAKDIMERHLTRVQFNQVWECL